MDDTQKIDEYVNGVKEFVEHNIKQGYLDRQNTVGDLLDLLENIKNHYIPICNDIVQAYSK